MKKIKIKKAVKMDGSALATYNVVTNTIHYDKELDKFPKLKKKVLKHEMEHRKQPLNLFRHMKIDTIDYIKQLFSEDVYLYNQHINSLVGFKNYEGNKILLMFNSMLYDIFNSLLSLILFIPLIISNIYYHIKFKEKVKE